MNNQQHTVIVLVVIIALLAVAAYFAQNGVWTALTSGGGSWPSICPPWAGSFGTAPCTPTAAAATSSTIKGTQQSGYTGSTSGSTQYGNSGTLNSADLAAIATMGYSTWANAHNNAVSGGAPGYTYNPATPPA